MQFVLIMLYFMQMVLSQCGSSASDLANRKEVTYSAECNNLAQYLVNKNQLSADLIDLLFYNRELILKEDANGWTPLHEAARHGNPSMVSILIANGVDALAKTKAGCTALDVSRASRPKVLTDDDGHVVRRFKLSEKILKMAEKGKGLDGKTINKEAIGRSTEVMLTMPVLANGLAFYGLKDELEELYSLNPELMDEYDENGWTILHEAARTGKVDILIFLLDKGADPFKKTNDGETAIDVARIFAKTAKKETSDEVLRLFLNVEEPKLQLRKNLR